MSLMRKRLALLANGEYPIRSYATSHPNCSQKISLAVSLHPTFPPYVATLASDYFRRSKPLDGGFASSAQMQRYQRLGVKTETTVFIKACIQRENGRF